MSHTDIFFIPKIAILSILQKWYGISERNCEHLNI